MTPIVLFWSGGKDSTLALNALRNRTDCAVVALLTTFTHGYDRIAMHGVRRELAEAQAASLGVPLVAAWIDRHADNSAYERSVATALARFHEQGVNTAAFGDLFLKDIRSYRIALMQRLGWQACFPVWECDTGELAQQFLAAGFSARVCCVDTRRVPAEFAGRRYDAQLLDELPADVDPCGENGEFHTFVCCGPVFRSPISVVTGSIRRDGPFTFCDLIPALPPLEA